MSLPYTEKVMDHFKNPRNVGKLEDANAKATEGSPACGDMVSVYLKVNDDRWPGSWDELLTVIDAPGGADIVLYGSTMGHMEYARSLREMIAVDWSFDPARSADANPVTRPDGRGFPLLWQGGDPNEMVREYLGDRGAQRP